MQSSHVTNVRLATLLHLWFQFAVFQPDHDLAALVISISTVFQPDHDLATLVISNSTVFQPDHVLATLVISNSTVFQPDHDFHFYSLSHTSGSMWLNIVLWLVHTPWCGQQTVLWPCSRLFPSVRNEIWPCEIRSRHLRSLTEAVRFISMWAT